jgi:hypothetical protein
MAKNKTQITEIQPNEFIESFVENDQKKKDSFVLMNLLKDWSGFEPKMWGPSIIGFGHYHYKYASGHEGDSPILGFSPRKAAFSLYIYSETEKSKMLIEKLGKYKMSKACIYVKKLSDIDLDVLKELCIESIHFISEHHECYCRINN